MELTYIYSLYMLKYQPTEVQQSVSYLYNTLRITKNKCSKWVACIVELKQRILSRFLMQIQNSIMLIIQ